MFAHAQVNYDSLYRSLYIQYNPSPFGFTKLILPIDTAKLPTYRRNNIKGSFCYFNGSLYVNNGTAWTAIGSSNYYPGFGLGLHIDTFYVDTTKIATKYQVHDSLAGYATTVALTDTAANVRSQLATNLADTSFILRGQIADTSFVLRQLIPIEIHDTAINIRFYGATNLADTALILRGLIPSLSGYATTIALNDTAINVRSYSQTNLVDTATQIRAAFPSTAGLATTVALTDTAIARAATAQTNLVDTASVLRGIIPSIYVNSVVGTSPITASVSTHTVTVSLGTVGLANGGTASTTTTSINATPITYGVNNILSTGVNSVVATGVMTATGTTTVTVGMPQSNTSTSGYLSSTDWNTFNGKGSGSVTSIQVASNAAAFSVTPTSAITSSGIYSIVPTGTSSQFVKADGSKDGTTYLSSAVTNVKVVSNIAAYTVTPTTSITSTGIYSLVATGTSSQFAKGDGSLDGNTYLTAAVTSVGLVGSTTMSVTGTASPITGSGTYTLTIPASSIGTVNLSATGSPSGVAYLSGTNTWSVPSGTPGGSSPQLQYNNSGSFGGASEFEISSDGNLAGVTQSYTTTATSPTSGRTKIYSSSLNGAPELHTVTDGGIETPIQTAVRNRTQGRFYTNGTSLVTEGFYTSAAGLSGAVTFNLITYDAINTAPNYLYYKVTTAASANSQAELYYGFTSRDAIIGNDAAGGGSQLTIIFCLPNYASTQRVFVGYAATFGNIGTTADPSAQLNTVGVGKDAADATLQFMFNNGSGTATKISTGITPTANDVYIVTVTLPSNTTTETVSITRKKKGSADIFATSTASSKIPAAGTLMYSHALSNTGAGSVAVSIGIISFFEEKYGF